MNYIKPVDGPISAGFKAKGPYWPAGGHNGVDFAVPARTPVKAATDGIVIFEGWGQNNTWMTQPAGICILTLDTDGTHSGYAHLSETVVNKVQEVKKGQIIGYVGTTGSSTGPHLHFEKLPARPDFNNGVQGRIDPMPFFKQKTNPAPAPSSGGRVAQVGTFESQVNSLRIRRSPSMNGAVVGKFDVGGKVKYDSYIDAEGYRWISWIGNSGNRNYAARRTLDNKTIFGKAY